LYRIKCGGIYIIEIDEYYYIGKSVDIFSRWSAHYTLLKGGTHHSPKLQEMFNEFGLIKTTFKVLEYVSITDFKKVSGMKGKELTTQFSRLLDRKEREWMNNYSINFCMNKDNKYFK